MWVWAHIWGKSLLCSLLFYTRVNSQSSSCSGHSSEAEMPLEMGPVLPALLLQLCPGAAGWGWQTEHPRQCALCPSHCSLLRSASNAVGLSGAFTQQCLPWMALSKPLLWIPFVCWWFLWELKSLSLQWAGGAARWQDQPWWGCGSHRGDSCGKWQNKETPTSPAFL